MTGTMALAIAALAFAANAGEAPPVAESTVVVSTESPEVVACHHCGHHHRLPNASGCEHIAARLAFWHMRCHSPCNMYPRSEYPAAEHGNYYFRAYNWQEVAWMQQEVASWGGDPRNPVSNQVFESVYRDLGVAETSPATAEEVRTPPVVRPNSTPDIVPSPSDVPADMEEPQPVEAFPLDQDDSQLPPPPPAGLNVPPTAPDAAVERSVEDRSALTSSRRVTRAVSYHANPLRKQVPVVEPSR